MKRKGLLCLLLVTALAWGCTKKAKTYTRQEMDHIVDSIVHRRAIELKRQAKKDLELRLPIELKPKVDSLLHLPSAPAALLPQIDTSGDSEGVPAEDTMSGS